MKKFLIITALICSVVYVLAQVKPSQVSTINASVARGELVYKKVCLSCHMMDGGGVPHLNPPLIQTAYVLGDKSKIIYIVLNGMADRVPIEDDYYSNNMAAHTDLNNRQIADVLTYVRNSFGNKASAVTVAEVKAVRSKKK